MYENDAVYYHGVIQQAFPSSILNISSLIFESPCTLIYQQLCSNSQQGERFLQVVSFCDRLQQFPHGFAVPVRGYCPPRAAAKHRHFCCVKARPKRCLLTEKPFQRPILLLCMIGRYTVSCSCVHAFTIFCFCLRKDISRRVNLSSEPGDCNCHLKLLECWCHAAFQQRVPRVVEPIGGTDWNSPDFMTWIA